MYPQCGLVPCCIFAKGAFQRFLVGMSQLMFFDCCNCDALIVTVSTAVLFYIFMKLYMNGETFFLESFVIAKITIENCYRGFRLHVEGRSRDFFGKIVISEINSKIIRLNVNYDYHLDYRLILMQILSLVVIVPSSETRFLIGDEE